MKLERISANKIKYSITFEELTNKGFLQDEILKESFLWDVLFDEMLDEAGRIFELNHFGAVSVEIFSLTSKELVLILTIEDEEGEQIPSITAGKYSHNGDHILLFQFDDFEHVILLSKRLTGSSVPLGNNSLYVLKNKYFVKANADPQYYEHFDSIFSEYGDISIFSDAYLGDYGELIIENEAIHLLQQYF
ncbi:adaptor protein MecA [Siminovitchia sp. 179-K 8D1 HS]|uniref:adaptor protein MecA n=1 Tax=Siminovitchia sp. 179-K 8D1 HS TaxID=3142385 RepID=UPI0039A22396